MKRQETLNERCDICSIQNLNEKNYFFMENSSYYYCYFLNLNTACESCIPKTI